MSVTGADPEELRALARGGAGQAFVLDHRARALDAAQSRHRVRNRTSRVDAAGATRAVRRLGRRAATLDAWVLDVAASFEHADTDVLGRHLLSLGAGHPVLRGVHGPRPVDPVMVPLDALTTHELELAAGWVATPLAWRDRVHRERARRWLQQLPDRVAAVPDDDLRGIGGWLARLVDRLLVDRVSPVTDVHVTREERVELLHAQATGLEQLLERRDLTVLSFDAGGARPGGGASLRVALGDVGAAEHVAVVLPGTSVGLHAPGAGLRDAVALHDAAGRASDETVATVLDLYDAPLDLGRAADPRTGTVAGAATARFLDDLSGLLPASSRVTLVGHSYGAFTAARAASTAPDRVAELVLLGAPGVGAPHVDDLGLDPSTRVWAARAPGDPIVAVSDLDELVAKLPAALRARLGPLARPDAAFGPDPVDPEFGARVLPTGPAPGASGVAIRGHVDYLAAGTASVAAVAAVVVGRDPRVRPARPPRRDRPSSAADD